MQKSSALKLSFSVLYLIVILSCGTEPKFLSKDELERYINKKNSGLTRSLKKSGFTFCATYRPTDLIIEQHAQGKNLTPAEVENYRNRFKPYYYFLVRIDYNNQDLLEFASPSNYAELLETISFRMGEYVHLVSKIDTINVADYTNNRTFGLSRSTDFLFVFENAEAQNIDNIQLVIDEFGLGVGPQALDFNVDDIRNSPQIKW